MKKAITDLDITNKRVIIRVDFNVPMKDGKIIEEGTHNELMNRQGEYYELVNS